MPMPGPIEILLAEDEKSIREALVLLLEGEGYVARSATNGEQALSMFREHQPDIALLDVMMPRKNGFIVCAEMRKAAPDLPILFLTAKDAEKDELKGLGSGADDYISKTSSPEVLLARIAAAARRVRRNQDATSGDFDFGSLHVDTKRNLLVAANGQVQSLTLRELEMLRLFQAHPGEIFSRDFLLTRFWGVDFNGSETTLSSTITRLRNKLGDSAVLIEAVYGQGYRFHL